MDNMFGITKEDVLELAAKKLVDEAQESFDSLIDRAERNLREKINEAFTKSLQGNIDSLLVKEMETLMRTEFTPVNVWGEKTGKPTTIRDALHERAKLFWEVKVDDKGKETAYYGKPRSEHLMRDLLNEEFTKAIRENATEIVLAFKEAVRGNAAQLLGEHIEKLIPVKKK